MAEYDPYDEYDEDLEAQLEEQDQCYYGWGLCIDPQGRDMGQCFACELMLEATRAATEEERDRTILDRPRERVIHEPR